MRFFLPVVVILIIALAARRRRRAGAVAPDKETLVGEIQVDETGVTHRRSDGTVEGVRWDDLRDIHIETVAGGLNAAEVMWVLESQKGERVRVAQTATGADRLIARLQQLPGFRYEPMIQSMITTDATRFVVWERHPS